MTMSSKVWQHPYVDIFKHVKVEEWRKSSKEGDVTTYMDKTLKASVYRIRGSIPASNYILLPKTISQSLGLTGHYFYLLFRPSPTKHFVVHLDVASEEGQAIRISFSNLFKEFKSTATWLQFPFLCGASKGSVYEATAKTARPDLGSPAPARVRWTCLVLDLRYILSVYLNRRHSHLKSVRLCASMSVKNLFTSDILFDPGMSFAEARQVGMLSLSGTGPMPRVMCFPVPKGENWHNLYDYIRFPSSGAKMPHDSFKKAESSPATSITTCNSSPRELSHSASISKPVQDRISLIHQITTPKPKPSQRTPLVSGSVPELGTLPAQSLTHNRPKNWRPQEKEEPRQEFAASEEGDRGVHVFVHQDDDVVTSGADSDEEEMLCARVSRPIQLPSKKDTNQQKLQPDPILRLNRIIGFGGCTTKFALWTRSGDSVVYPCHAMIVSLEIATGEQRFFIGHTDKVSALAFSGSGTVLASAQTGSLGVVRVWDYQRGSCVAMFKSLARSLSSLSFSYNGGVLCGVGRDNHGKTMVVVWDTQRAASGGEVLLLAKAHTDVDVQAMKISAFDDTRMVSCGRENIRLWRLRGGSLRSCPVNLGEYHSLDFTDVAFGEGPFADREPEARSLFASSRSGHVLEVDCQTVTICSVRRLLPVQRAHSQRREKQTFSSDPGIAVNSISVSSALCATGSEDGYLRVWPRDFSAVLLEAEHDGPVSLVSVSTDGLRVLAATSTGSLGFLDVSSRSYRTLMRSHTDAVLAFSVDGVRRHVVTASCDSTVRVWDLASLQQLYDFACEDTPRSVAFHPSQQVFSCGFGSGTVRVFHIATSRLLAEHKQHRGEVTGLIFSPDGQHMYSSGSLGTLALYDSSQDDHHVLRVLGKVVARGSERGPDALALSTDSRSLAFVGPSEYTVTIMNARSLDECDVLPSQLLRVDVSILDVDSTSLDSAVKVCFAPASTGHLLVSTSANKILWLNAGTGRLLRQVSDVHKQQCSSLAVSEDGRFLLTAGHKAVKVWDYAMRLDVNSQVFIGHSQPIQQAAFTPDQLGVLTVGDGIYYWDFLAQPRESAKEKSSPRISAFVQSGPHGSLGGSDASISRTVLSNGMPRETAPLPSTPPPRLDMTSISKTGHEALAFLSLCEESEEQRNSEAAPAPGLGSFLRVTNMAGDGDEYDTGSSQWRGSGLQKGFDGEEQTSLIRPDCYKHFTPRFKMSCLDQSAMPPCNGNEGLVLKAVIGYNGNGRGNMIWKPDTGLFAYTCGCVVVVEDLHTGTQRHWLGHSEEVSCLAVTNDAQTVASASGGAGGSRSLICIWNVRDDVRKNTLSYHKGEVQGITFSRDDMFFLSIGDYREPGLALWSTRTCQLLTGVALPEPLHDAAFSPGSASLLACVGSSGALFYLLECHGQDVQLKVQRAAVPAELGDTELTALCYGDAPILYTGTNGGHVCAWDGGTARCFMTWEADDGEIGVLLCRGSRLLTGSNTRRVRLWAVGAIQRLRPGASDSMDSVSVLMEQEMTLDGTVVSAAFDDALDMGIVGTTAGTLWYISWAESTSIRLISGHRDRVNSVVFSPDEGRFATCGEDGSLRVWAMPSNELLVQFQVLNQGCSCVCWSPLPSVSPGEQRVVAGYSDGTLRVFCLGTSEMELKLQPHSVSITAVRYSAEGQVVLSGGSDGLVAVSSPLTGMTIHIISDHKGAPITSIQCVRKKYEEFGLKGNEMWLASSADRRVSIWVSDWMKDKCELLDWLTFPAPSITEELDSPPPSLGAFCPQKSSIVLYTGYGVERELIFYSLSKKQIVRKIALSHWASCLSPSPQGHLVAVGCNERLLKIIRATDGKFLDFPMHSDSLQVCGFSPSGKYLFTSAYNEIFLWEVKGL
ncbi:WD repeat-containing protein 90 isoform X2 [Paramormyrops kingsleyae]|uniref:WD repeat-containing protein 90 isoform X2 n=1 Tax=Paramormyrops kingsleyae TaxID=1676925 RepID=UPI003B96B788